MSVDPKDRAAAREEAMHPMLLKPLPPEVRARIDTAKADVANGHALGVYIDMWMAIEWAMRFPRSPR